MKTTIGKWQVERHNKHLLKVEADMRVICEVVSGNDADARVIAAAPDLLAALQLCADKLAMWPDGNNPEFFPSLKSARAAIAKAEGAT